MKTFKTSPVLGAGAALLLAMPAAFALPINGTGLVTGNLIFGGGNVNGGFTGVTSNGIEIGLRAKQRYPAAEIYNYDGDHSYIFDSNVLTTNPANRSVFNFEWHINVEGVPGTTIDDFDYLLEVDRDPELGVDFSHPNNSVAIYNPFERKDHSFGNTGTAQGAGLEAAPGDLPGYLALMAGNTVSQQSWNLGFEGFSSIPNLAGYYRINLSVFTKGTTDVLATTSIDVRVVPEPATLALMIGSLGLFGVAARRRGKRAD